MADGSPRIFHVTGAAGLRDIARLAAELSQVLAAPGPLEIDCSGIAETDLSFVQLLLAAHRTAQSAGKTLTLVIPATGPLAALLAAAGFVDHAGRPLTPEGGLWTVAEARAA